MGILTHTGAHAPPPAVHPHTHGDFISVNPGFETGDGSPPHAWGFWIGRVICEEHFRFTPTRMGILAQARRRPRHRPVHPHTHGDFYETPCSNLLYTGSPPHAWGFCYGLTYKGERARFTPTRMGILSRRRSRGPPGRFTPTRMGILSTRIYARPRPSVHPHTHGDFRGRGRRGLQGCGSPPHAWGF